MQKITCLADIIAHIPRVRVIKENKEVTVTIDGKEYTCVIK